MNKLSLILKNPIILVLPIVVSLLLIWQQYSSAQQQIAVPQTNILPNAGLDELDSRGIPIGWQVSKANDGATVTTVGGYNSPVSLLVANKNDTVGSSTTLTSPLAIIQHGEAYFYKSFYKSDIPFDLLLRTNRTDGSHEQEIVGRYDPNDQWETVSYVFSPPDTVQSVQFIYNLAGKGELQIDNAYLEVSPSDTYIQPQPILTANTISNTELASSDGAAPDGWNKYTEGDNQSTLTYEVNNSEPLLRSRVLNYKTGEAKWRYNPIDVQAGQAFQFNVTYQSDVSAKVVAEYTLASGQARFETIVDLLPSKEWTKYVGNFEIPARAKQVAVTIVQRQDGTISTKKYGLYDITKPGERTWGEPRLSVTFDDGWESAYEIGSNLLNHYGYRGTFYLNPSTIDTDHFMTSSQVADLARSNHEIASHGYEHLDFTTLERTGIDYQLKRASDYFEEVHGMKSVNFSAPFGGNDAQTTFYARKYYASLRGTKSGTNTLQNIDKYNLKVLYVGKSVSLEKMNNALADARDKNGWLILVYHRIESSGVGETILDAAQFQQQLEAIKKSDIKVTTVSAALQQIGVP